ncbi:hypothetical protein Moror_13462 [Moniliophthora roreri MCA 2997]|uniref:Uncharacterized protein n=1 Tax=Moniliophthora roreri (strain MCA 2997) TaxID=1381753 RepID=V2WK80_MONRO|nr:hypothetical protein Moror_13462 [Moniliophthora roreri MCA 2997]
MYDALRQDAEMKFQLCAVPMLHVIPDGKMLADQVALFQVQEEGYFHFDQEKGRPLFTDPTMHGSASGFQDYCKEDFEEE